MPITKETQAVFDGWEEVAQNAIREGAEVDLDLNYAHVLYVDHALTSETAHDGTEILVQISSSNADDEFWSRLSNPLVGVNTAASELVDDNPLAANATTITISSTTGLEVEGTELFLKDVGTFANSEIVYQTDFSTNTDITIMDGVKRSHAVNSILYNVVETLQFFIPVATRRVRVIYNNTIDSGGSTVATRARLVKVTGV